MIENGIGASVRRKEDNRFLTGKGNYTDDVNVVGQTHAYFVRSPHAHAKINNIDTSEAISSEGVIAVFTGDDLAADGIGPLICGVNVTGDDGEPHKSPAHPALAQGKVNYVGDLVAVVIAETLAQANDAAVPTLKVLVGEVDGKLHVRAVPDKHTIVAMDAALQHLSLIHI